MEIWKYSLFVSHVILTIASSAIGAKVQLFKVNDYTDLRWEGTLTDDCYQLPSDGRPAVYSVITDKCLIAYSEPNCKSTDSTKYLAGKTSTPHSGKWIQSLKICNDQDGGPQLNIDIIEHFRYEFPVIIPNVLEKFYDVYTCINVPRYVQEMSAWSIDNHHNELYAYFEPDCTEKFSDALYIEAGHSHDSREIYTQTRSYYRITMKIRSLGKKMFNNRTIMEMEHFELSNYQPQNLPLVDSRETFKLCGSRIKFYGEFNFQDFLFERNSTETCGNLLKPNEPKFVTDEIQSIETDTCIMIYSDYDCKGRSLKLEARGSKNLTRDWEATTTGPETLALIYRLNPNWKFYTKSFSLCNEGHSRLNVDITEYQGEDEDLRVKVLERYRDICTCQDIPKHVRTNTKWSINNFGHSMIAYFEPNCMSNSLWIPAGRSSFTIGSGLFRQKDVNTGVFSKILSFGPDTSAAYFRTNCLKMYSTITKFEIYQPVYSNYEERNVTMLASKTVFRNDGPSQLTQSYSASKTVRESMQVDIAKSFSEMDRVHVDESVDIEIQNHKGSSESSSSGTSTGWNKSKTNSVSKNQGFENRQSASRQTHESTDSRKTDSSGTFGSGTVGAEVGYSAFGFSGKASASATVGGNTGTEQSKSNTQGSSTGNESVQSISGSSTSGQDETSGLFGDTTVGQENMANYFQEDGFKHGLRKAYERSGTLSSSISNSTTIEKTRSFAVTQTITVPPCTEQVVHASVQVVTNKLVEFRAISKITGQLDDQDMTSNEIRQFMNRGLEYIQDFDEYTVLAYSTGVFTAEYGVSSIINSEGRVIESCLQEQQQVG